MPAPTPTPPPAPAPAPTGDWRDWPLTPGDWIYRGGVSQFGVPGADATFTMRCDSATHRLELNRAGTVAGNPAMTIITTSLTRALPSHPGHTPSPGMVTTLAARDPLLDAMGYSRGRFIIEQRGLPTLVIPAWPEIERVTEDCRR